MKGTRKFWMQAAFSKHKGALTRTAKRTGRSFAQLAHSRNPLTRKRANLALIAKRIAARRKAAG